MGVISSLLGNAGVVPPNKLHGDLYLLLAEEEKIQVGFRVMRDTFVFTDKRLMIINVQGVSGKKVEYESVPYGKITRFSVETAGSFDLDAELKIWVGSEVDPIQKRFNKKVNIYDLQRVLANYTLQ
ncbi:MAG: PH domain-containing protein [Verrucomicrobiota bacterium]